MRGNNRLRWILAAMSVVAVSVLIAYFEGRTKTPEQSNYRATGSEFDPAALSTPDGTQSVETFQSRQASLDESAWVIVDPKTAGQLPAYKEIVPGRALVRVSEELRKGTAGDRITLEVPQIGEALEGVVERVDTDPYGNVSYLGLVTEADGRDYRFVITAGPRNTFATINTSRGAFELVASHDLGWLMPTAQMDQHVDYSQPDYFIPEPEERIAHEQE